MKLTKEKILEWLEEVKDPEIPVLSLIDLGVITGVELDDHRVKVNMTPTFSGCPAMDYMRNDVIRVLKEKGVEEVEASVSFETQWNSNMISEKGKKALKEFGLAPPQTYEVIVDINMLTHVKCPFCDSENTELKSPFGPTLCRSLHYCNNCLQAFEQFKPL